MCCAKWVIWVLRNSNENFVQFNIGFGLSERLIKFIDCCIRWCPCFKGSFLFPTNKVVIWFFVVGKKGVIWKFYKYIWNFNTYGFEKWFTTCKWRMM